MLNGGGAVVSAELTNGFGPRGATARMVTRASGDVGAYASSRPRQVRANGSVVEFGYNEASGLVTVRLPRSAQLVELTMHWRRGD